MISVVIPTWNEAASLPATLESLEANSVPHELIVVDAASTDSTCRIAQAAGARILNSPRQQRATQMNLGARHASGDTLLFLHADTWLRANSLEAIEQALAGPGVVGGAFARRFDHPALLLRFGCWIADLRGRLVGWFFGDQGIFIRRKLFAELGGFKDWDLYEDIDFARRMRRAGQTVLVWPPILSSGRRFRDGAWRRTTADFWLICRYFLGRHA